MSETDPYVYPGTNVLKNKFKERDAEKARQLEADVATARLVELEERPIKGRFDLAHLRKIHKHIFQDMYSWAGQVRSVKIEKEASKFALPQYIETSAHSIFAEIERDGFLAGADLQTFARRAGHYLAEINALHPFREGNGRAQRAFISELALNAGYKVDWTKVTREEMLNASVRGFNADSSLFEQMLRRITIPVTQRTIRMNAKATVKRPRET